VTLLSLAGVNVTLLALYGMNVTLLSRSGSNVTLLSLLSLGSRRAYHSDRRHPANDQVIFRKSLDVAGAFVPRGR
jgi:hypothetical protein